MNESLKINVYLIHINIIYVSLCVCVCVCIFKSWVSPTPSEVLFGHGMVTQLLPVRNFNLPIECDLRLDVSSWVRSIQLRETYRLGLLGSR